MYWLCGGKVFEDGFRMDYLHCCRICINFEVIWKYVYKLPQSAQTIKVFFLKRFRFYIATAEKHFTEHFRNENKRFSAVCI